jgi:hypothetical protein
MTLPGFIGRIIGAVTGPKVDVAPRPCPIDGKPMRELRDDEPRIVRWRRADLPIFRCPDNHEFSPGNFAEGLM